MNDILLLKLKTTFKLIGLPPLTGVTLERQRLEIACLVGQCVGKGIVPGQLANEIVDWLETATNADIDGLWTPPTPAQLHQARKHLRKK